VRDKTAEYAEAIKKAGLDSRDDRSKEYAEIAKMAAQQSKVRDKTAEYAEAIKKAGLDSNKFERVYRKDAAGNLRSLDLPIDKNGYARDFAKRMSKSSSNPQRDYEYWFKYMMSKYKYQ